LEPHYVTTDDGFILTLHRIPCSRSESAARASGSVAPHQSPSKPQSAKPAVLIWHGFLMCSEIWVCQPVMEKNLAFVLAEAGYDVWLGNTRGNKYSSKHLKYKRGEEAYWDFSMDTLALFDMPAAVNYIIKTAGVPTLSYIGFSQGTAQGFSSLSLKRDLNKKVNIFIALAPATKPKGLENKFINSLISAHPEVIYLLFGRKVLLSSTHFWSSILSPRTYAAVIDACMWFLFGWTSQCIDHKNIVYRHLYSYTSVKTVVHWFQIMRVKRFQMYDENPTMIANASTGHVVPRYPTEHIQTPVALFYGGKDTLPDTQYIIRNSPTPVFCLQVLEYEHLSFIWGTHQTKLLFPPLLGLLHSHSPFQRKLPLTVPWISYEEIRATVERGSGVQTEDGRVVFDGTVSVKDYHEGVRGIAHVVSVTGWGEKKVERRASVALDKEELGQLSKLERPSSVMLIYPECKNAEEGEEEAEDGVVTFKRMRRRSPSRDKFIE
ncbi:Alpha/Beta hydrolase protein, partial [Cladochytrium replicatum]